MTLEKRHLQVEATKLNTWRSIPSRVINRSTASLVSLQRHQSANWTRFTAWVAWRQRRKNTLLAVVLAFAFGPVGMLYATWVGALVMFIVDYLLAVLIVALAGNHVVDGATSLGPGDIAGLAVKVLPVVLGLVGVAVEAPPVALIIGFAAIAIGFIIYLPLGLAQSVWAAKAVREHNREIDRVSGR